MDRGRRSGFSNLPLFIMEDKVRCRSCNWVGLKKVAFNNPGAAKLSLYQCFNIRARTLAYAKPEDPNTVNFRPGGW